MERRLLLCMCALIVNFFVFTNAASNSEFIFRLLPAAKECFYDYIEKNQTVMFEYEVNTGEDLDVDISIVSPSKKLVYQQTNLKTETYIFKTQETGIFKICFDNRFSRMTSKDVYLFFRTGEEQALRGVEPQPIVLTLMETYANIIHTNLNKIKEFQTHQLLAGRSGSKFARNLNKKVQTWSAFHVCIILVVGLGQVFILRKFFTEKKPEFTGNAKV